MSHHRPPPPWTFFGSFHWKNILFAGLAATIVMYFTDAIVFGGLGNDYFAMPGMHKEPLMGCMIIGYVIGGFLFSMTYAIYAWPNKIIDSLKEGGPGHPTKIRRGLLFGIIIALVAFLPNEIIHHSLLEGFSLKVGLTEVVFRIVQFGAIGILVAHLLPDSDSVTGTKRDPIVFN